eukprot:CAMPEP_0194517520 /NCGR_PEP_ID=MMETSP0253-20130528/50704_1 /TAXON_ID=2966 /ORGANISM="Noctiluca scintillans" /LENGTH=173 /DNA_ID=CAMNT_0039361497 /DNA_START=95 /DNA_END=615 /DNA_ORIENTATION=-
MASLDNAVSTITASPELFNAPLGVQFDPVDEASRHMTFMFFGEHLRAMPGADLTALHAAFCEEVTAHSRDMAGLLSFRCFEFFPPTKMNLIAALLRSVAWAVEAQGGNGEADEGVRGLPAWNPTCPVGGTVVATRDPRESPGHEGANRPVVVREVTDIGSAWTIEAAGLNSVG